MNRLPRPDGLHLDTADRNQHVFHDRASMSPSFSLVSIPSVNPEPAYIAPAAAANVVTSEMINEFDGYDDHDQYPESDIVASVAPGSLSLINAFLDRLLFNFLSCARSTSLASLRPAVVEVLKPRLAKEAIAGADEELQEYLGGDDDELNAFHNGDDQAAEWDLDLVWKRTRLRCMVYTRLGDMEEEDEEMYIEQEHLGEPDIRRISREVGIVSPAVAIFLTSVLEFVGEHALMVAGQAAYKRTDARARMENIAFEGPRHIIVEEVDMEKVALNSTLGRLWRSWRKLVRSPRASMSRMSREVMGQRNFRRFSASTTSRKSSIGTADSHQLMVENRVPSVAEVLDGPDPTSIPLPFTDHDVAEIEVPGYSPDVLRHGGVEHRLRHMRPFSMLVSTDLANDPPSPPESRPQSATSTQQTPTPRQSAPIPTSSQHRRSHSLPTPQTPFFVAPEYQDSESGYEMTAEEIEAYNNSHLNQQHLTGSRPGLEIQSLLQEDGEHISRGDYVVPSKKPHSAPSSPHQQSIFNAISKQVAKEPHGHHHQDPLRSHNPEAFYDDQGDYASEIDPADGALQFDQDDYKVDDEEHDMIMEPVEAVPIRAVRGLSTGPFPAGKHIEPSEENFDVAMDANNRPTSGEISPVGQASIHSGEVSPIEPSDDESTMYPPKSKTSQKTSYPAPVVSPIKEIQRESKQSRIPQDAKVMDQPIARPMPARQRRKDGPSEDDYAKEEKREAFVIPEELPTIQQPRRASDSSSLSGKDLQADGTISAKRSRGGVQDSNGAPNLAPLREMMEAAPDTSDSASSRAPSQVDHPTSYSQRATAFSNAANQKARVATHANNISDQRRPLPPVSQAQAAERFGVQGKSPSPVLSRDVANRQNRSSDNSSRDIRATSSGSSNVRPSSSTKPKPQARVRTNSGEAQRESLPSRASSDGSRGALDEKYSRSSTSTGANDRQKSFEQLMNSGETIQYTLTPQNMREIEVRSRARAPDFRTLTSVQEGDSSRAGQSPVVVKGWNGRTSIERTSPKQTRPLPSPQGSNGTVRAPQGHISSGVSSNGPSFIIHSGPAVKRGPQAVPRDARVEGENIRDFADFIRSTGPDGGKLSGSSGSTPIATTTNGSFSGPSTHKPIVPSPQPSRISSIRNKPRLQARDPTIRNDESSDLIDFIRQGPPAEKGGSHRIPRTVAPFRSTMDSDEIQSLGHGRARDANSLASTQGSFKAKSIQSSVNSRTGLLESGRQAAKAPMADKRSFRGEEHGAPVRKQRRVRDPYAIDSDDEENDDDHSTTPKQTRNEESLIDFLNSAPPPQANNSPPRLAIPKSAVKAMKTRANSERSRFGFGGSGGSSAGRSRPLIPATVTGGSDYNNDSRSYNSSSPQSFEMRAERQRNGGVEGRARIRKNMTARAAREDDMDVRGLADFLRNSGPPDLGAPYEPPPKAPEKESSGFTRMFSRRRRNVVLGA